LPEEDAGTREARLAAGERTVPGKRGTRSGTSGRRVGTGAGSLRARPAGPPTGRRQRAGVLLAVVLVLASLGVVAFVYLTRWEPPVRTAPSAEAKRIPTRDFAEFSDTLSPGRYASRTFNPDFTFTVGKGWSVRTDAPTYLELVPSEEEPTEGTSYYSALAFNAVETIIYPKNQHEIEDIATGELGADNVKVNEGREAPVPDDIITWLQEHPYLKTSEPQPVTIGNKPGIRIDAEVAPVPDDYSEVCAGAPCVVLFNSQGSYITLPAGGKTRLIVLKGIEGKTVIISSQAYPASDFDSIVSQSQRVLDTVEWKVAPTGSTPDKEPQAEAKSDWAAGAKTTPDSNPPEQVDLAPGTYVTDEFEPSFTFSIGEGWADTGNEQSDIFGISMSDIPDSLAFVNAKAVYDVPSEKAIATPNDLTAWFQRHPYLETSDPTSVSVGGVSGKRFEVVLSEVPPDRVLNRAGSPSCFRQGDECVPTFILNTGDTMNIYRSNDYRITVLDDVADETVAIVESKVPDDPFLTPKEKSANEKFFSLAEEVLSTVEWKVES
jgi:hypothetical protein